LVSGRGLTLYDGSPLWLWGPFYPMVPGVFAWVSGATSFAAVPFVNSVLFGGTIFLTGLLLFKHLASKTLALLGTLAITCSAVLVALWLLYPGGLSHSALATYFDQGWGMSNRVWRNSQTINYVMAHPTIEGDCTIYSNVPDVLYLVANLESKGVP